MLLSRGNGDDFMRRLHADLSTPRVVLHQDPVKFFLRVIFYWKKMAYLYDFVRICEIPVIFIVASCFYLDFAPV